MRAFTRSCIVRLSSAFLRQSEFHIILFRVNAQDYNGSRIAARAGMIACSTHDAGRIAAGYFAEKNDCTVRAYATATAQDYMSCHAELFMLGRKMRKGFKFVVFARSKGWQEFPRPHMTVQRYIQFIAGQGNWIILIRGHVFAVTDGVIHDLQPELNLKRHVLMAWRVK